LNRTVLAAGPTEKVFTPRNLERTFGGVLYVDSLSDENGPVPSYLDLLRVTVETIAKGFDDERA